MRGYDQLTQKVSPPVFQTISDTWSIDTWSIDTWSIGTVRSFKAVPPGQRTDVPGQPGGLPDGSRRSQRSADLRSTPPTRPHPNGVPDRTDTTTTHVHTIAFWHPSGMPPVSSPNTGGLHFIPTSGYPLPTLRVAGGNTRHLKFTDTTGSFDTVCALKGVSFDLRTTAPGQPGGLPEGSRRSKRSADLRSTPPPRRHPNGVPDRSLSAANAYVLVVFWHPSGMRPVSPSHTGGLHSIPTSGYRLATLRLARRARDTSVAKRFR
jgi:hypothetical protein